MKNLFQQRLIWSASSATVEMLEARRMLSVTTINVGASLANAVTNPAKILGVNIGYWDDKLNTAQTKQMVQAAGLNQFRFPGGSASDDFHFTTSANYSYVGGDKLPNFAQFIESVNGTGLVTLDYGSGSPQESEAELAYLVGSTTDTTAIGNGLEWNDTASAWQTVSWGAVGYWASLRASTPLATDDGLNFLRASHPAPFVGINSWEVGNEEYGSWEVDHHGTAGPNGSTGAAHDPATYAAFAAAFANFVTADQANLPSVSIGIDSDDPTGADYNDWTRTVLTDGKQLGFVPGFISDHRYVQEPGTENDSFLLNDTVSDPASISDWSTRYTDYQTLLQQTLGSSASNVQITATEFNSVSYDPGKQTTSLVDGLFIADSLGSLLDSGYSGGYVWNLRDGVYTADNNSSSLYGWRDDGAYGLLGAPDTNSAPDVGAYVPYPSYFAEQLVSKMAVSGGEPISVSTNTSGVSVYAEKQSNGHLDLLVINKSATSTLTDQFNISGFNASSTAQVWQYGETQDTAQSLSTTGASSLANFAATLSPIGGNFSYTFPAYSMSVIDLTPAVASVIPSVALTGSNYLELDASTPKQLDVWAGTTNTGTPAKTYNLSRVINITDTGSSGLLTVNFTNGDPLAAITDGIAFNTTAAATSLAVVGDNDGDSYAITKGQILVSGGTGTSVFTAVPITFANTTVVSIQAGAGPDALSVAGPTAVDYTAPVGGTHPTAVVSSLSVGNGSTVVFNSPNSSRALLELNAASSWNGQLDLQSNDLLVHGGLAALTTINAMVTTGYDDGSWTGQGIASSSAAMNTSFITALGVIQNTAGIAFDGAPILTTDVLVKYTYYGDANLDGTVSASDFTAINNGFANHITGWAAGDFNYDQNIDGSDFTLIDNVFNSQGESLASGFTATQSAQIATSTHDNNLQPVMSYNGASPFDNPPDSDSYMMRPSKKDLLDGLSIAA